MFNFAFTFTTVSGIPVENHGSTTRFQTSQIVCTRHYEMPIAIEGVLTFVMK